MTDPVKDTGASSLKGIEQAKQFFNEVVMANDIMRLMSTRMVKLVVPNIKKVS
jgi:hypothetical protein